MENRNQNHDDRKRSSDNPGMNASSNTNSEQNANASNPEGGNWPEDETLREYMEKDRKSKMKPGSLDRE